MKAGFLYRFAAVLTALSLWGSTLAGRALGTEGGAPEFLTRGEFIVLICSGLRGVKEPEPVFEDVSPSSPYFGAVATAYSLGIAQGDGSRFYPDEPIKKCDAAVFAYRRLTRMGSENEPCSLDAFSDGQEVPDYAGQAMVALYRLGAISAEGGELRPNAIVEPSQAMELAAAVERLENPTVRQDAREAVLKELGLEDAETELSPELFISSEESEIWCGVYLQGLEWKRARVVLIKGVIDRVEIV